MKILVTGMRISRGFTLIEILIVLVIIGITIGFAIIAYGDFGEGRRITFAAEQLAHILRLAQQQAILDQSTLGLRIDSNSYQILQFQNNATWAPLSNKGAFKTMYFPKSTVINLKSSIPNSTKNPSIIINASGDMTPFTLSFGTHKEPIMTVLNGRRDGSLTFTQVQNK